MRVPSDSDTSCMRSSAFINITILFFVTGCASIGSQRSPASLNQCERVFSVFTKEGMEDRIPTSSQVHAHQYAETSSNQFIQSLGETWLPVRWVSLPGSDQKRFRLQQVFRPETLKGRWVAGVTVQRNEVIYFKGILKSAESSDEYAPKAVIEIKENQILTISLLRSSTLELYEDSDTH